MSWSGEPDVCAEVRLTVPAGARISLAALMDERVGRLWLGTGHMIDLDSECLAVIRTELPGVLAALGIVEAADERVDEYGSVRFLGGDLCSQADAADAAGEPERAAELRTMADKLKAALVAVESALDAVSKATDVVDAVSARAEQLLKVVELSTAERSGGAR